MHADLLDVRVRIFSATCHGPRCREEMEAAHSIFMLGAGRLT